MKAWPFSPAYVTESNHFNSWDFLAPVHGSCLVNQFWICSSEKDLLISLKSLDSSASTCSECLWPLLIHPWLQSLFLILFLSCPHSSQEEGDVKVAGLRKGVANSWHNRGQVLLDSKSDEEGVPWTMEINRMVQCPRIMYVAHHSPMQWKSIEQEKIDDWKSLHSCHRIMKSSLHPTSNLRCAFLFLV